MYPTGAAYQAGDGDTATIYAADAVLDAAGCDAAPGAVAVRGGRILAAGPADDVIRAAGRESRLIRLPGRLLVPGMVNAHAHLELTALGPRPYTGDFVDWIIGIRASMPEPLDLMHESNCRWAVQSAAIGARRSLEAGVAVVGDISKFMQVHQTVGRAGLRGVGFVEFFGLGPPFDEPALQRISDLLPQRGRPGGGTSETPNTSITPHYRLGLQPHAPYSTGPRVYEAAAGSSLPVTTHLAETRDELTFIASAGGPYREFIEGIRKWDDAFATWYDKSQSPVQWMSPHLRRARWLVAHCNYVSDEDIALLADTHAGVAYCPRAGDYFGHADHRYRDMLDAGVNVALGADSILCHGTLSILDEMRHLHQRDRTDPRMLLEMGTINGMTALGMDPRDATFSVDASPGIIAIRCESDTTNSGLDALQHILSQPYSPAVQRIG